MFGIATTELISSGRPKYAALRLWTISIVGMFREPKAYSYQRPPTTLFLSPPQLIARSWPVTQLTHWLGFMTALGPAYGKLNLPRWYRTGKETPPPGTCRQTANPRQRIRRRTTDSFWRDGVYAPVWLVVHLLLFLAPRAHTYNTHA